MFDDGAELVPQGGAEPCRGAAPGRDVTFVGVHHGMFTLMHGILVITLLLLLVI